LLLFSSSIKQQQRQKKITNKEKIKIKIKIKMKKKSITQIIIKRKHSLRFCYYSL